MKRAPFFPALCLVPLVACVTGASSHDGSDAPALDVPMNADAGDPSHARDDDAMPDAPATPIPPPPSCPADALPTNDACTIHESFAVFVSATRGSAKGDGSRAAPLASLAAGIELARRTKRRVYACGEGYEEAITIQSGVSMFGYFDCASGWRVGAQPAHVRSLTSPAVTAVDIHQPTRVEAFEFFTARATLPGASSIAMRAVRAPALALVDVRLESGDGAAGASGAPGIPLVQTGDIDGHSSAAPMSEPDCLARYGAVACNVRFSGGVGGTSVCAGANGFDGGPGGHGGRAGIYVPDARGIWVFAVAAPEMGSPLLAQPETAAGAAATTPAQDGANGEDGSDGASAKTLGVLSATGYVPASGRAGTPGKPGQGGGGGRAGAPDASIVTSRWYGSSGAGGGAGGCPGLAGGAGQGGGASIALLAFDSPLRLEGCVLRSARGGAGGKGTLGSEPTAGGAPGAMVQTDPLTYGGAGGRGGRAGVSGHGAGGPSFGIAMHGAAPVVVNTTVDVGAAGAGQPAIQTGNRSIETSASGLSEPTHAF